MCVCTYVCVYTYTYTYVYIYIYIYVYIHIHIQYIYIYIDTYIGAEVPAADRAAALRAEEAIFGDVMLLLSQTHNIR